MLSLVSRMRTAALNTGNHSELCFQSAQGLNISLTVLVGISIITANEGHVLGAMEDKSLKVSSPSQKGPCEVSHVAWLCGGTYRRGLVLMERSFHPGQGNPFFSGDFFFCVLYFFVPPKTPTRNSHRLAPAKKTSPSFHTLPPKKHWVGRPWQTGPVLEVSWNRHSLSIVFLVVFFWLVYIFRLFFVGF